MTPPNIGQIRGGFSPVPSPEEILRSMDESVNGPARRSAADRLRKEEEARQLKLMHDDESHYDD